MSTNAKTITVLFNNLLNQPVKNVELGHGSFLTLGFGKDLPFEIMIRGKKEIEIRPEWLLWVYMCSWELEMNGKILSSSDDERDKIKQSLTHLSNKKLIGFEIVNDYHDMKLVFEDNITLSLFANNLEDDNEQWLLYTPERKVLVAGPFDQLTYSSSSSI